MTIKISSILILAIMSLSFQSFNKDSNNPANADPTTEVKTALDGQVAAWNSGDLEKAMTFYWNSPEMLWISKVGVQKGYQPVLEDFLKEFKDRSKMGVYSYSTLFIEEISSAVVHFVIRWQIVLGEKKLMGGVSSQIWKKINGNWVITSEHAG